MNLYSPTARQSEIVDNRRDRPSNHQVQSRSKREQTVTVNSESSEAILAKFYGPVRSELQSVEQQLNTELSSPYPELQQLLRHGTQLGGKRLRPAMVLLFGHACGHLTPRHQTIATVVEMVHTATLIHDDVLDGANERRHVPTINAQWNAHTSILVGDYLFSQAYRLAATTHCTTACEKVGEAARRVCEGELRQVLHRDHISLDEITYLSMLQAKTGELCRVACELGARFSGASEAEITAAARFGNSLGIAFQIADDYLDLWGDDQLVGKTLGTDLEQGKTTLPIIRLLETASAIDRLQIQKILEGPAANRAEQLLPMLEKSDAQAYTRSVARQHHSDAILALEPIGEGEAKRCLKTIADFSIDRRF